MGNISRKISPPDKPPVPVIEMVFEAVFRSDSLFLQVLLHLVIKTRMVLFQRQHVVSLLFDNLRCYLALAPYGINADRGSFEL